MFDCQGKVLMPGLVNAHYTSGSGTQTLVFSYTIGAGNSDSDGIMLGTDIQLAGSTIKDNVLLDAQWNLNNVPSTSAIYADAIAPYPVSIIRYNPTEESVNTSTVVFNIEFSVFFML
jgi:predicted amidohydrolase YtcJ